MTKKLSITLLLFQFLSLQLFAQKSIYVSTNGRDNNSGTYQNPFLTLNKAQAVARKIKGSVIIYINNGTYYLNKPLLFTSLDSRAVNEPLTIKPYGKAKVVISGGMRLNLNWKVYRGHIMQAKVNANFDLDELFVNGKLQRMARYPNYSKNAKYLGGTAADAISISRAARWKSPEGGYLHAIHQSEWGDFSYRITGKNKKGEPTLEGGGKITGEWVCIQSIVSLKIFLKNSIPKMNGILIELPELFTIILHLG